ncbi:hypothetical protein Q5X48_14775 [Acinetobacter baumannii]|nr:hypothetical protein [Acinetobacter baumannii]
MSKLKGFKLSFVLLSLTSILTACGENFSVSNVSLGGSGSGQPKPPVPPEINIPSTDSEDPVYAVTIPEMQNNECMGIHRSVYFIFTEGKQPVAVGSTPELPDVSLQFEIKNTTSHYIFERADQCKPFRIIVDSVNFSQTPYPSCPLEQYSVQILQPYESKIYTLNLNFIDSPTLWSVNHQVSYSTELQSQDNTWEKCTPLQISFPIHRKKK